MMKIKHFLLLTAAAGLIAGAGTLEAAGNASELDGDTVAYDMQSGVITAEGNVLMKNGTTRIAGSKASYNTNTQDGTVEGNVIAIKDDMRMTAAKAVIAAGNRIVASGGVTADRGAMHMTAAQVTSDGQNHFVAEGDVHGSQADKTFSGPRADYQQDTGYVLMDQGGIITSADGTFTADHMEGWLNENHFKGIGNAHIVSPPRDFEGGGDTADYYGNGEKPMAVLDGNAWAVQDNNTLHSGHLTVYLANNGAAAVQ
jgi:lipopolysaccharide export system protein LptA